MNLSACSEPVRLASAISQVMRVLCLLFGWLYSSQSDEGALFVEFKYA
jgi:hypothetical protein